MKCNANGMSFDMTWETDRWGTKLSRKIEDWYHNGWVGNTCRSFYSWLHNKGYHKLASKVPNPSSGGTKWYWSWVPRTCTTCGGIHPEDLFKLMEEGWEIEGTY